MMRSLTCKIIQAVRAGVRNWKIRPPDREHRFTPQSSGNHKGATEHFKTAYGLGKENPEIQNSGILKAHLKMH